MTFEEQWNVRHILIAPSEILDLDSTKALLTEIRDNILNGLILENWQENILKIRASASQGGELDWLPRGVTAPEFEVLPWSMQKSMYCPLSLKHNLVFIS